MTAIAIPEKQVEVVDSFDVLVAGGGMAGVAAAVCAARSGLNVGLIEYFGRPGGIPTSGLLGAVSGAYTEHEIAVAGFAAEVKERVAARGGVSKWWDIVWDPETLTAVLLEMLAESGVKCRFYTQLIDAVKTNDKAQVVIVASKSGIQAIEAKLFVDATGDGDLAAMLECPYEKGRETDGLMQSATLVVKLGGIDRSRAPNTMSEITEIWRKHDYKVPIDHVVANYLHHPGCDSEATLNMVHITRFDATSAEELTRARFEGTRQAEELLRFFREQVPGFENAYITQTANQIGVRETRRFTGDYVLTEDDVISGRNFDDEIVRCCWPIDIHDPDGIHTGIGRHIDQSYGIPYRCITPKGISNVLIAGRPISATHVAFSSSRINATCTGIGQAAGCAAKLAIEAGDIRKIDVQALQQILEEQNVVLHKGRNLKPGRSQ